MALNGLEVWDGLLRCSRSLSCWEAYLRRYPAMRRSVSVPQAWECYRQRLFVCLSTSKLSLQPGCGCLIPSFAYILWEHPQFHLEAIVPASRA